MGQALFWNAQDRAVNKKTKSLLLGESDATKSNKYQGEVRAVQKNRAGGGGGEWGEGPFYCGWVAAVLLCCEGTKQS